MATEENLPDAPPGPGAIRSAEELSPGDRVVYPNQGVCKILGRESKEIAGQKLEFVSMAREEDGATILVPVPKVPSIGLRKVADRGEVDDVFDLLASSFDDPELDWKVRHRTHGDLLMAGGVLGVAEVLKGLQALGNLRPLPQKERERYDAARHLLVHEMAVALGVPHCTAEDFIDLALIPPPGTERPARKPRKLAPLRPLRPRPGARRPVAAMGGDVAGLDLDADLEEEEEEEETAEGEEAEVAAEVEEGEEQAPVRPAPRPAAKAAAKTPAARTSPVPAAKAPAPAAAKPPPAAAAKPPPAAPAKAAVPSAPKAPVRAAPAAKTAARAPAKPAAKKAPPKPAAKKAPARKAPAKKPAAKKPAVKKKR